MSIAELWLQPNQRETVYQSRFTNRIPYNVETSLDSRQIKEFLGVKVLRQEKCQNFDWYLNEIYPGLERDRVNVENNYRNYLSTDYLKNNLEPLLSQYNKLKSDIKIDDDKSIILNAREKKPEEELLKKAKLLAVPPVVVVAVQTAEEKHIANVQDTLICSDMPKKYVTDVRTPCEILLSANPDACTTQYGTMMFTCPKSCGLCGTDGKICFDFYEKRCPLWESEGQCRSDSERMSKECRVSCGLCTKEKNIILSHKYDSVTLVTNKESEKVVDKIYEGSDKIKEAINKINDQKINEMKINENSEKNGNIDVKVPDKDSREMLEHNGIPVQDLNHNSLPQINLNLNENLIQKEKEDLTEEEKEFSKLKNIEADKEAEKRREKEVENAREKERGIEREKEVEKEAERAEALITTTRVCDPYTAQTQYKNGLLPDPVVEKAGECSLNNKPHGKLLSHMELMKNDENVGVNIPKIFCGIYTMESNHKTNVQATRETWGKKCDGFVAFSTIDDDIIPAIKILHRGEESYNNMWQKSRSIWKYIHAHYIDQFDYFLIGGDDMFYIIENLRHYLMSEEISTYSATHDGTFLGRRFYPGKQFYRF